MPTAPGLTRIRPVEPEQNAKRTVTLTGVRNSVPRFSTQWMVPSYHTAAPGEAEALDCWPTSSAAGPAAGYTSSFRPHTRPASLRNHCR